MKLKLKSWYANIYQTFYWKNDLPISLCKFFWMELVAIILLPIWWITLVINFFIKNEEEHSPAILVAIINLISLLFESIFISRFKNMSTLLKIVNLTIPIFGWICFILGVSVLYLIVKVITYLGNKWYGVDIPSTNWFSEGIKSFFGKYCPKIDWK